MISLFGSTVALGLALYLRAGRTPSLKPLSLPLLLTAIASLVLSLTNSLGIGEPWTQRATTALIASIGFLSARGLLLFFFDWILERRMGISAPQLIRDVAALILYLALAVTLLRFLGVEVTGLIATSAVVTVVIGLAFQQTLGELK